MRNKQKAKLALMITAVSFLLAGCGSAEHRNQKPAEQEPAEEEAEMLPLPRRYDGREHGRTAAVKNQGDLGTCWAFASLLALKNSLLPAEALDFSEDHMSHDSYFVLGQENGGDYTMAMAYLLSWRGPVSEQEDPYGDGVSPGQLVPVKHVQEINILPPGDQEAVKRAVVAHGGVQSSLYTTLTHDKEASEYYNSETKAYYYAGDAEPNHDVVIVGWNDDFPKEAFSMEVPGNGAFLCENSWGTQFGEEGFFYVSYYDANLGTSNVCYSSVEENDNYDFIYQSDPCGWVGQLGYGRETAWAVNVYEARQQERLEAVGFYAIDCDTDYEVYVISGNAARQEENPSFSERRLAASGRLPYAGYYTIPLDEAELLKAGEPFGVMIKLTTPGAIHPIAIEYDAGDGKCRLDLDDGEGYISPDGSTWERLETQYRCNVCLKAYSSGF